MKHDENVPTSTAHFVRIKKVDEARRLVSGLVYEPNVIDTWGDMMLAHDIEAMAHRYLKDVVLSKSIDTMHDNLSNGCYPVESFIARAGDPDYSEGSWVLSVKITEDPIWDKVKRGELNGFSFQAWVVKTQAVVELDVDVDNFGMTEQCEGHTHTFWAELDDEGIVRSGRTSTVNGHSHLILRGTATEMASGHAHRIFV